MTIVYDSSKRRITLVGKEVGHGGEAVIRRVQGQAGLLAKIYVPPIHPHYEPKVAWMKDHPPEEPDYSAAVDEHKALAWPIELLYDAKGRFTGYLMPRIRWGVTLLKAFNPRLRTQALPFNHKYLHRIARNLAAAVTSLHAKGYVVGDLHESNVLVTSQALVTMIDTDSFQVHAAVNEEAVCYHCVVGKPEYTAPELQGKHLADVTRKPEQDNFALAVLIFQLLMQGNHPFRSRWGWAGEPPSLEVKIARGLFPHVKPPPDPVTVPPNVPSLDTLHPVLSALMQRCFVDGHKNPHLRPTAAEWRGGLEEAEAALVQCAKGHYYSNLLVKCPQCEADKRAGKRAKQAATARRRRSATARRQQATFPPRIQQRRWQTRPVPPPQSTSAWARAFSAFRALPRSQRNSVVTFAVVVFSMICLVIMASSDAVLRCPVPRAVIPTTHFATRAPLPTLTPNLSPTPAPTLNSILASSIPLSQVPISADNAEQITRLSVLGLTSASYTNWSLDGKQFIAILPSYGISIYDAQTMDLIRFIEIDVDQVSVVSSDWTLLATRGDDGSVKLWDMLSGQELHTFRGHKTSVYELAFSPNGNLLAIGSYSNSESLATIDVWDVVTGREMCAFSFELSESTTGTALPFVFSPDGKLLASRGASKQTIRLWKIPSGELAKEFFTENLVAWSLAFSPDGQHLAVGGWSHYPGSNAVSIWDVASGRKLHEYSRFSADSVAFSPDGTLLAALISGGDKVKVWSVLGGTEVFHGAFSTFAGNVNFSPDGRLLSSGFFQWEVMTGREVFTVSRIRGISALHFSHDGRLLTSASYGKTLVQWEIPTTRMVYVQQGGISSLPCPAFSSDGAVLAWGPFGGEIELWQVSTGDLVRTITVTAPENASCVGKHSTFSLDGTLLAANLDTRNTVEVWDVATGNRLYSLSGHTSRVRSVAFSPTGKLLASWAWDDTIRLWKISTGNEMATLSGFPSDVVRVVFSPDGASLAIGLQDGTVKLWDVIALQELRTFFGHTGPVTTIAFSPDGTLIASGSEDETVKLWDVSTGYELRTLDEHNYRAEDLAFSSDGTLLASAGFDTVNLWGMPATSAPSWSTPTPIATPGVTSGAIGGIVVEADTGLPISGASVTTEPPTGSVTTDVEGRFVIPNVPPGRYTVTVTEPGYVATSVLVSVQAGEVTTTDVVLLALPQPSTMPTPSELTVTPTPTPVVFRLTLAPLLTSTPEGSP